MNTKQKLIQEIEKTSDVIIEEVLNFLLFTKSRYQEKASENKSQTEFKELSQQNNQSNRPIWELFEETAENIPDTIVDKLPRDGAEQHDHYLYGTPKRQE